MWMFVYVYVCVYMYMYVCMYMYMYTNTHTHTHTHIYVYIIYNFINMLLLMNAYFQQYEHIKVEEDSAYIRSSHRLSYCIYLQDTTDLAQVNNLSQDFLGYKLIEIALQPGEYTGERVGLQYLLAQTCSPQIPEDFGPEGSQINDGFVDEALQTTDKTVVKNEYCVEERQMVQTQADGSSEVFMCYFSSKLLQKLLMLISLLSR